MTERLVRLKGQQFDLEELSELFTSNDLNVRQDEDGHFYLRASDFNRLSDSDDLEGRGRQLVQYINGAAKLTFGPGYRAVEFDTTARIEADGQRYHSVVASITISGRSRMSVKPTVIRADGTVEGDVPQRPNDAEALVELAHRDHRVADALRFYERDDWINLYKVWEVVCDAAGGSHSVVARGWAIRREQNRFTGTAQSSAELGDEARHASQRYKAPKEPMTLDEARGFVGSVIRSWVGTL